MKLSRIQVLTLFLTQCFVIIAAVRTAFMRPLHAPEGRIVGGSTATPHGHPYMISLQLRFLWVRAHFCGGSLLNSNWVLTAGHCVTESWLIRWLNIDAVAGAHNVDVFTSNVQIEKIVQRIPHDNYLGGIGPYDIAMLKTENPFALTKAIRPIRLPPENVDLNAGSLVLSGWGALKTTTFIPLLPNYLQELNVTYIPYEKCLNQTDMFLDSSDSYNPLDETSNVCTGPLDGGKAACVGDSGGPLILIKNNENSQETLTITNAKHEDLVGNGIDTYSASALINTKKKIEEYLVGVVSWGVSPCGGKGAPTVYTDVSKHLNFIKSYINT